MIPLRDENPTLHTSVTTFTIIGVNALVWLIVQGMGQEPALSTSVCQLGVIPGELLGVFPDGGRAPLSGCVLAANQDWLTPLTSMFMHGGWFHILGNMWFLWVFGDNVEDSMGPWRFIIFYVICGFAAVAAQVIADPDSSIPMVGASGAIGGVLGAYAVLYPKVPVHMLIYFGFFIKRFVVPAILMLGYWFVIQLLGGVPSLLGQGDDAGGGVAFWAHIGGFLAGVVLVFLFQNKDRVAMHEARRASKQLGN